jgi:CRISPR-associated protein Csa5
LNYSSEDPVEKFAGIARLVVHLEQAYDITDELSRSPDKYEDSLAKLSRLAVKVLKDIDDKIDELRKSQEKSSESSNIESKLNKLKAAKNLMINFNEHLEILFRYLRELENSDRNKRNKEIKRLAALMIAPDKSSLIVKEIMEG